MIAGAIFTDEGGLDCWRALLLGSIVVIEELKAGINTEGFGGLDFKGCR